MPKYWDSYPAVSRAAYERNKAMNIPAMQNVTEIAPILRFRFGNATTTYGEMLTEDGRTTSHIDMAYIDEYYDLRGLRTFKTAYIGAVGGVFYDAKMNVLDYWGYDENRGGRHNCTPEGIVTAPDKTRYVRTNINPRAEDRYLGTTDGRDNWIELFTCKPIYSDSISIDYVRESGERFYRAKLKGTFTFVKADYEYIANAPMEKQFYVRIDRSTNLGSTWYNGYIKTKFVKTDCKFDMDARKVDVELTISDKYDEVLAGMNKEYNLIRLAPAIEPLSITKRPVVQLYVAGNPVLTNMLGNMNWEQEVVEKTSDDKVLRDKYKFVKVASVVEMKVAGKGAAIDDRYGLDGVYAGVTEVTDYLGDLPHQWTAERGTYKRNADRVEFAHEINGYNAMGVRTYDHTITYKVYQGDTLAYSWSRSVERTTKLDHDFYSPQTVATDGRSITINPVSPYEGVIDLTPQISDVYGRVLTALDKDKNENPYLPIPSDDIVERNKNYGYIAPVPDIDILTSGETTSEPTEWGRLPDDYAGDSVLYYKKPEYDPSTGISRMLAPIGNSSWGAYSLWVDQVRLLSYEDQYNAAAALRHTYPLWSCINALLKQIAPQLHHTNKPYCSEFLYGQNNPIRNGDWQLFLTQNTNVKSSYYENPAQNAPITLRAILDMLRDCFRCYWFIDSGGAFRIEHVDYFRNGGSYNPANHVISYDITNQIYARNGKRLVFNTNKYSFDKEALPERYQFGWGNETTQPFKGFPIEIRSRFVEQGKIEDISVSNITTDLDYMLLRPSSFSDEGLVLIAATPVARHAIEEPGRRTWVSYDTSIQLYRQQDSGLSYRMQNGELSFFALAPLYYTYDLPARRAVINEAEFEYGKNRTKPNPSADLGHTIHGMKRRKTQEKLLFSTENDPDPATMIRTGLGDGEIESYNVSILHRLIEAKLYYDTDAE